MEDSYLQPILSTNDCKNHIISALQRVIDSCMMQTTKAICDYQSQSGGQESEALRELYCNIEKIEKTLLKKILEKPYCLQKASLEIIDKVQGMINKFNAVCSMIL